MENFCKENKRDMCQAEVIIGCENCKSYIEKSCKNCRFLHQGEMCTKCFESPIYLNWNYNENFIETLIEIQDKLSFMFSEQKKLQENFGTFERINEIKDPYLKCEMKQHFIDKMILAAHEELSEINRETISKDKSMPFGWKQCSPGNEEKYKEEIIDLWHFTMNLWLIVGGTSNEFFELYLKKNFVNKKRINNNGKY